MRAGPSHTGRTAGMFFVVEAVAVLVFGSGSSQVELQLWRRLRCWDVCGLQVLDSSRCGVYCLSCFVDARSWRVGFQRAVSFLLCWSWVPSFSQANSRVSRRVRSSRFPRAKGSSKISGPCLRQRRLALELTILCNENMLVERGR